MQQGIQYFTLRKYRSLLEIKNTTHTGVLATNWNFYAHFWNFVVLFLDQKTFFSTLSVHELKKQTTQKFGP